MTLTPSRVLKQFRYAMYFNGVGAYVLLPNIPLAGEVTLFAWFWDINIYTSFWGTVFSWYYSDDYHFILNHYSTTGLQKFTLRFLGTYYSVFSSTTIPNKWVFATGIIFIPQGFVSLYWNAVPQGKTTFTPASTSLTTPSSVQVGRHTTYYYFNGYIAQVLLYSRPFSYSEILWNYQYPDNPVRNGLVLWLQADPNNIKDIDGDGILEWIDLSGFGNHGKIYGAQLVQLIKTPSRLLSSQRVLSVVR